MPPKEQKSAKAAKKDKDKAIKSGLSLKYVAGIWLALAAGSLAIAVRAMQLSSAGEQLLPGVFSQTECHSSAPKPGARGWVANCSPRQCGKVVLDDFASAEETAALLAIAARGMAMGGGAGGPTIMDMASGALAAGRANHALNGVKAGARFLAHDIFNSWGKLTREGPYDLVICDPPSFQKGSFVATKDYARLARRLPALLAPEGLALLCLNTPKLGLAFLQGVVAENAPELAFIERVANPAAFADASEDRSLKVAAYRLATQAGG